VSDDIEVSLKTLKRLGVKSYKQTRMGGQWDYEVEFFAPSGETELEKKPREDEKVNEATGLTPSRTQDILCMDE
jgi:hypothetical protein